MTPIDREEITVGKHVAYFSTCYGTWMVCGPSGFHTFESKARAIRYLREVSGNVETSERKDTAYRAVS